MAKVSLRYGFKSEANRWARDLRNELGLSADEPLCPWKLAKHLSIPVHKSKNLCAKSADVFAVSNSGKSEFSAVTIFVGVAAIIIYNSNHSKKRQASDLAHEIAHILLGHRPKSEVWVDGQRHYDKAMAEEANWLGPALLISEEAAFKIASDGMTVDEASDYHSVTVDIIRMRLGVLGVNKRMANRGNGIYHKPTTKRGNP